MTNVRTTESAPADLCSSVDGLSGELQQAGGTSERSDRRGESDCKILDVWLNILFDLPPEKRRPIVKAWCKARPHLLVALKKLQDA